MDGSGAPTPTGVASTATDLQAAGQQVVVKLVPPEVLPTPAMADRALRELKQLAKVTSDRIVRVVDQGRLPDGRIYVVTERVDGAVTLEELIGREGPLPLERARSIVLQVGEALTEAQKVGVIHRDVAPRNILVGPGDRVKVADFGLAEPVTDRVFGAPAFLSPEQAEGKPVDQRSNIYSLGAVYYFALTGATPFVGDAATLMSQHLSAVAPAPSTRRPGLGADVDRVIGKALEKSGGRRHLTLRQLLTEVAASQANPTRAGSEAKTMMGEAPVIPPQAQRPSPQAPQPAPQAQPPAPQAQPQAPQRPPQPAHTIMGMSSPLAAMGPPGPKTAPSVPAQAPPMQAPPTQPTMPVAPATTPIMDAVTAPAMAAPQAPAPREPSPPVRAPQESAPQAPMLQTPVPKAPQHHAPQSTPQAATMMAEAPRMPAASTAAPVPAPGGKNNTTGKKGAFRETAWFKRGEIEEEMAKAQAAAGENALKSGTTGQHLPVDESQVALSAQDRDRLSLKTGATQAMPIIKAPVQALPGERMDEAEMLAEINPSKKYFLIAGAIVLAIVIGLVLYFTTRPAPQAEAPPGDKPAPVAAAPPASGATPTSPAPAPPTQPKPTPTSPAPTAAAVVSPSVYAGAVDKQEAAASPDKRELKRLEKLIGMEMKVAHKKKEKAVEAADRDLLARLKKISKKK